MKKTTAAAEAEAEALPTDEKTETRSSFNASSVSRLVEDMTKASLAGSSAPDFKLSSVNSRNLL